MELGQCYRVGEVWHKVKAMMGLATIMPIILDEIHEVGILLARDSIIVDTK